MEDHFRLFCNSTFESVMRKKNYCERRNEPCSWRSVALPNRHKHLCLFKLGYDVYTLLSSVMYILSGKKITAMYPLSRRRWDQNTTQVANRLNRTRATYVWLLHVPPCPPPPPLRPALPSFWYSLEQCSWPCVLQGWAAWERQGAADQQADAARRQRCRQHHQEGGQGDGPHRRQEGPAGRRRPGYVFKT